MSVDKDYIQHWDEKFRSRPWGRYPPEDLVRFMGRNFAAGNRSNISVLELGCGPGANLWFLHREGYRVYGIDGSPAAIEIAAERLSLENKNMNPVTAELKVGNFFRLPWPDSSFDVVIDVFSIYANTSQIISQSISEAFRVMKPGAFLYSKLWGRQCTGYGEGDRVEEGTFNNISRGPCKGMGVSHFFNRQEVEYFFRSFEIKAIDRIIRTDSFNDDSLIEEFHCVFQKPLLKNT